MRKYQLKDIEELSKLINVSHDELGNGEICLNVNEYEDLYSVFSSADRPRLNNELVEAIWLDQLQIPADEDITIKVIIKQTSKEKEDMFVEAFKKYYYQSLLEGKRKLQFNTFSSLWLLLTGIGLFLIYVLFKVKLNNELLSTILEIACWVFTWEAVNQFMIERKKLKFDLLRLIRIINSNIVFTYK